MANTPTIRVDGYSGDWNKYKIEEVATFSKGSGYSKSDIQDTGTPLVLYGRLYTKYETVIDEIDTFCAPKERSVLSKGGEVIVPASGESAEDISVAAVVKNSGVILGGDINIITPKKDLSPTFLAQAITHSSTHHELSKLAQGKTVVHLRNSDIKSVDVSYPSTEEQTDISNFFLRFDTLIELQNKKLKKLVLTRKAMLLKMFPMDGATVPEIRFSEFTDDWKPKQFSMLFSERIEKTVSENEDVLLSCAITGMYLNSELFGHFRGSTTVGYLKVKKNDLILSAQNLHLGNANVNLRFDHGIISPAYKVYDLVDCDPYFANAWVKRDDTKKFFLSATTEGASQCRKNIEWDTLYQQSILCPSYEEQVKIGEFFKGLDNLISLQEAKIEKLKNTKKALLKKMFV